MPYLYNSITNSVKWVDEPPEQLQEGESVSNIYVEPPNEVIPLDIPGKLAELEAQSDNHETRITTLEGIS